MADEERLGNVGFEMIDMHGAPTISWRIGDRNLFVPYAVDNLILRLIVILLRRVPYGRRC